ncbi:MAG: tRNA (adenosine(37)-N6)-threonylcarbamoyltransferase complex transferase subunit TsaD [Syntrophorhabdaceae bacterium]|nr:tRNA (adenosine(37)-N6)-threonylcarbamoyltransferase complex transferase subunit TsaD [Syntrophorhabdaceae bacterium]
MRVLGIESSCDETAAAVYDRSVGLLSNVVSSQVAVHEVYGGVVPELASREHLKSVVPVVEKALSDASCGYADIDGIAVTAGPGLIGSLLVGLCFAKSLSFSWGRPVYGADHLESHIFAAFLENQVEFPYIALLVSGGHTSLFRVQGWNDVRQLGGTLDDAAGEAFDKAAKMMGLGYPGGVVIDRLAGSGDPRRYSFPRARLAAGSADFSFSGLKTALRTFLVSNEGGSARMEDIAASFQEAIADVLVTKAIEAARRENIGRLVLSGGVSANSRLRALAVSLGAAAGVDVSLPSKALCTDNAAMVALLGERRMSEGIFSGPELNAYAASRFSRG